MKRKFILRECVHAFGFLIRSGFAAFLLFLIPLPTAFGQSVGNSDNVTLILKLAKGQSQAASQSLMRAHGANPKSDVEALDLHVVEVPRVAAQAIAKELADDKQVLRVEADLVRNKQDTPSDPLYSGQWALAKTDWYSIFGTVNLRSTTTLAILDTGVDAAHSDLSGVVIPGYSLFRNSSELTDENGHGTWVAGIAAARTDNRLGIAGVAYDRVQIMPVKVLDADGRGRDSDIIQGIVWAVDHGASVILMAFSNPGFSASLQDAIDYAWSKNVVIIAAAGNDSGSTTTYPAGNRAVVGVAATDANDALARTSTSGASVFLAAPGVSLVGPYPENRYVTWSGTSGASAIVAGAAALMRAADPLVSNGVIVNRLARTADPAGSTEETGNGRLNIARAILDTGTDYLEPAGAGKGKNLAGPYVAAASTDLPLRSDLAVPIFGGSTARTLATAVGSLLFSEPYSGTGAKTFDFYSPSLTSSQLLPALTTANATIWARNTSATTPTNFTVSAVIYDYNPVTGNQTQIMAMPAGGNQGVNPNTNRAVAIPLAGISTPYTIPAGHQVKFSVTMNVTSGVSGALLYNDTIGQPGGSILHFPASTAIAWPFGSYQGSKLAVTVNGGNDVASGTPFDVIVAAVDASGGPGIVSSDTNVSLSLLTGTGVLAGNTTGTISAGNGQTTISSVTYTKSGGETGVVLKASATSGDALQSGNSTPFNVIDSGFIDLTLSKNHISDFTAGSNGLYVLTVTNVGTRATTGPITVTDVLPNGMGFVSGTGTGWLCFEVSGAVTCSNPGPIAGNNGMSSISLTVSVGAAAVPSVTNLASVTTTGDGNTSNDLTGDPTIVNPEPFIDLSLTKSHSGNFSVGANATYTLTIINSGTKPTSGVISVQDTLTAGLAFVSGVGTGWNCSAVAQDVTCISAGPIAPNDGGSVITLTVSVGMSAAPSFINAASVSTAGDMNSSNNTWFDPTTVNPYIDLSLRKINNENPLVVGTVGTYLMAVKNDGTAETIDPITVVDPLPTGLEFASGGGAGWSCSALNRVVTCQNTGRLQPADTSVFEVRVNILNDALPGVTNVATVSTVGDVNSNNDSGANFSAVGVVDLKLSKSHIANFTAGTNGVYTFTVKNEGNTRTVQSIVVRDTLPSGLAFVRGPSGGPASDWSCIPISAEVDCVRSSSLPAGTSSSFDITVSVGDSAVPGVTNTATVTTAGDLNATNDSASDPTIVNAAPKPDLFLTKSHFGRFTAGSNGKYTLTVKNLGTAGTTDRIFVTDVLPAGLQFVSGPSGSGADWSCFAMTNEVTCVNLRDLTPGASSTIELTVSVGDAAVPSVTNTATVTTAGDSDPSNNTASDTTVVAPQPRPDLSLVKSHVGDFTAGVNGIYTLTVKNIGDARNTDRIFVKDLLPAGLQFVSGPSGPSADWLCFALANEVTCAYQRDLPPGASSSIQITVSVGDAAVPAVTNTATVTTAGDNNATNDTASDFTRVAEAADLGIRVTGTPDPVFPGSNLTYTIIVTNYGPSTAKGISMQDILPDKSQFVSLTSAEFTCGTPSGRALGFALNCTLPSLPSQAAATIVVVTRALGPPGTLNNTATVSSLTPDRALTNNTDSVSTQVVVDRRR